MTQPEGPVEQASPPRRWPRWMGWALVASLALNLIVVAAIATAAWRHREWDRSFGRPSVFSYAHRLPRERRTELLEAARAQHQGLRPLRSELRQARADVAAALGAKPFDQARYAAARDKLLAAELRAREAAHRFSDVMVHRMTDDERAGLAKWLDRSDRRRWRRDRGE